MGNIGIIRRHFETIGSTATWAKDNSAVLPHETITLVTAQEQTAGRGRFKRQWLSPAGENIYATYCHYFPVWRPDYVNLLEVMALSAIEVLAEFGFAAKIKWPNDLILSGKKLAGLLAEKVDEENGCWLFVSIGLNINMGQRSCDKVGQPATSLFAETGEVFDIEKILAALSKKYLEGYTLLAQAGFVPFYQKYKKAVFTTAKVTFQEGEHIWQGEMHDINPDGSLVLKLANGELKTFYSGELK